MSELQDMPIVTVEQVTRFRQLALSELAALREKCEELQSQLNEAAKQRPVEYVTGNFGAAIVTIKPNEALFRLPPNLSALLAAAKQEERERCLNAINSHIVPGDLEGNGFDMTAQRNGMILAHNLIMELKD